MASGIVRNLLTPRHLTRMSDLSAEVDLPYILSLAESYRHLRSFRPRPKLNVLEGRVVALVFEKPSLRTKVTFEIATHFLGGFPVFLSSEQILASGQEERGRESVSDIARNLERFCDIIVARVYDHQTIRSLASVVKIPVINALCDDHHPCQAITDVLTMESYAKQKTEKGKRLQVAYIGDGNNVATSLVQACAMRGHSIRIASPLGYQIPLKEQEVALSLKYSPHHYDTPQTIEFVQDPQQAIQGVDVVYTDTFVSMGDEHEKATRLQVFEDYQVNESLMKKAAPHAVFMHCLPAHRGEEVTSQVMDSSQSVVFDQAENRFYAAQAILQWSLNIQ